MQFHSFDGKMISVREWTDVREVRGVVQIAHGMNEYVARYDAFARRLNALGYIVAGDDHRGHGDTDAKTLGYAPGDMFADTVEYMAELVRLYRARYPGVPYVLFGFSYGSFLTQAFVRKYGGRIDGAIIAGSSRQNALAVRAGRLLALLGGAVRGKDAPARLVHKIVFGGYGKKFKDGEWLSVDAANNTRYHADPYCEFVCSNHFFASFFKGLAGLYKKDACPPADLPIFLLSGKQDPVGDMGAGVERLAKYYRSAGVRDVTVRLIDGARHEFLNESVHFEEAIEEIAAFLGKVTGA